MCHHPWVLGSFFLIWSLIFVRRRVYATTTTTTDDTSTANNNDDPPSGIGTDTPSIKQYLTTNDMESLHQALEWRFQRSERNLDPQRRKDPLSNRKIKRGGGLSYTSHYKLKADLEQVQYLLERYDNDNEDDNKDNSTVLSLVKRAQLQEAAQIYQKVLDRMPPPEELHHGLYPFTAQDEADGILKYYNRDLFRPSFSTTASSSLSLPDTSTALNPNLDFAALQRQWETSNPSVLVIDNLLSAETLSQIQQLLWESTVFYQTKLADVFGGYTGAYLDDGLHDRILLQVSRQLRTSLPGIFAPHPLKYLWAYKYDSDYSGIVLHADEAAVNVNIWITPNQANLAYSADANDATCQEANNEDRQEFGGGGLVVFTVKPPKDWDVMQYNRDATLIRQELLQLSNFANVTIEYRENRAVLFDSALFHQTDDFSFLPGYNHRRINLTFLFGEMQKAQNKASS